MRHTKVITIEMPGRDKAKQFVLTEMWADQGENWAYRALLALSRGGIEVPPGLFEQGFAGLAQIIPYAIVVGLKSLHGSQWNELEPLLKEMMGCVVYLPPGAAGNQAMSQPLLEGSHCQIEEIATFMILRKAVLELHLGFSVAGDESNSDPVPNSPPPASSIMQTSQGL